MREQTRVLSNVVRASEQETNSNCVLLPSVYLVTRVLSICRVGPGALTWRAESKMADEVNFREVVLHVEHRPRKAIDFSVGSTSATTIKDEECVRPHAASGYAYRDSGKVESVTRNRFIYWWVADGCKDKWIDRQTEIPTYRFAG